LPRRVITWVTVPADPAAAGGCAGAAKAGAGADAGGAADGAAAATGIVADGEADAAGTGAGVGGGGAWTAGRGDGAADGPCACEAMLSAPAPSPEIRAPHGPKALPAAAPCMAAGAAVWSICPSDCRLKPSASPAYPSSRIRPPSLIVHWGELQAPGRQRSNGCRAAGCRSDAADLVAPRWRYSWRSVESAWPARALSRITGGSDAPDVVEARKVVGGR